MVKRTKINTMKNKYQRRATNNFNGITSMLMYADDPTFI